MKHTRGLEYANKASYLELKLFKGLWKTFCGLYESVQGI